MGFLDAFKLSRLKEGLAKTREALLGKVQKILTGKSRIDEELLQELEEVLISGDVGVATTMTIIESLRSRVKKEGYEDPRELDRLLRDEIEKLFLAGDPPPDPGGGFASGAHKPHVVMVVGVNGVGKTTTIGKLAYNEKSAGKSVVIAAADTFRAAANEQLEIWAQRAGVEIIRQRHGADPSAVAYDALLAARSRGADLLIIDTAGRLHTNANLMEELKKMRRVLQKIDPTCPHEVLLILDASTGQNGLRQAHLFSEAVGVTGLVVTKLDGTAKGGVVLGISRELSIPVRFIGVGEELGDLQPFDRQAFVAALFEKQPA
jgi:fused signal recognition particle receptor